MPDLTNKFFVDIMMNLSTIGSRDQWFQWRNELFSQQTVNFRDKAAVRAWHEAIYRQHGPRLVGRFSCTLRRPMFTSRAAPATLPVSAAVPCGGGGGDAVSVCGRR